MSDQDNTPCIVQRTHLTLVAGTMGEAIEFRIVRREKPGDTHVILGQSH